MTTDVTLTAPSYVLLHATTTCWKCLSNTPVTVVWVPSFVDLEEQDAADECAGEGGAGVLRYIQGLDDQTMAHLMEVAPWLKLGHSGSLGEAYWANHCGTCDALQGDHFLHGVDGPFFPQTREESQLLRLVEGFGPLQASAVAGQSGWMDWIADRHMQT
ncbi:hypothetical protein [Stenotrophomonas sp. C1657]|uniref:hypothetical protein n=1 Tax=Stenotrophomonas sp. C1657 TaxID=3077844 RepID=UPI00293C6AEE|nr:hypothetical protein [Stenotrophomonas sp. C1657]MDV3514695.1 hypothetical protein [Stenotrophomonas sp. C1657]